MPGVKLLHQDSQSNSKAEYIMGHSLQVLAVLAYGLSTHFAIPLIGEIHEGIRLSCGQNNRTLLDKMFDLLIGLNLTEGFYFVADRRIQLVNATLLPLICVKNFNRTFVV